MTISVLTLVRDRREQLINLMKGLGHQTCLPDELIIAYMQPEPHHDLPDVPFALRTLHVTGDALPLAEARNQAAWRARSDNLIFLDVDCIPSPSLVESYARALTEQDGLYLGEVFYLPAGAVEETLDYARLDNLGRVHPARPAIPDRGLQHEPDPGNLWGLSFALHRHTYRRAGGMDVTYTGYGGEETDFAWRLAEQNVPFFWVAQARAYHQHHPIHAPPYQHFDAILRNASRFHRRWRRWCMEYWLAQFRDAGLIAWSEQDAKLEILRHPTAEEIANARLPDTALFS